MNYPFSSIQLNGRDVLLCDIAQGIEKGQDEFEITTLSFIQRWITGAQEFELQTSGSTGPPKRIQLQRRQMEGSALATIKALGLKPLFNALICLDTKYIAGQMMLVRCFVGGMAIYAVTPAADPMRQYGEKKIHFTAIVPYQVQAILKSATSKAILDSVDNVIIGGAALSDDLSVAMQDLQCKAFATFGMTETISHIALRRINGAAKSDAYHILPGVKIDVDDRSCLILECPYLPEKIVTNDLVEILNPVTFRWMGRADNVINTGGVKVSPEAFEQRLQPLFHRLNLHDRFIISSLDDIALGEKLVLVLESQNIDSETKAVLTSCFHQCLEKFELPKIITAVYPFPVTGSGKLDRRAIKKLISEQHL